MSHGELEDGPLRTRGWAIGNQRTEASMGPQTRARGNLEYGPRGKDTTKELQGPQRRDQHVRRFRGTMRDA